MCTAKRLCRRAARRNSGMYVCIGHRACRAVVGAVPCVLPAGLAGTVAAACAAAFQHLGRPEQGRAGVRDVRAAGDRPRRSAWPGHGADRRRLAEGHDGEFRASVGGRVGGLLRGGCGLLDAASGTVSPRAVPSGGACRRVWRSAGLVVLSGFLRRICKLAAGRGNVAAAVEDLWSGGIQAGRRQAAHAGGAREIPFPAGNGYSTKWEARDASAGHHRRAAYGISGCAGIRHAVCGKSLHGFRQLLSPSYAAQSVDACPVCPGPADAVRAAEPGAQHRAVSGRPPCARTVYGRLSVCVRYGRAAAALDGALRAGAAGRGAPAADHRCVPSAPGGDVGVRCAPGRAGTGWPLVHRLCIYKSLWAEGISPAVP